MLWVFHGRDVTHTMYCMGVTVHPQVRDFYFSYFQKWQIHPANASTFTFQKNSTHKYTKQVLKTY